MEKLCTACLCIGRNLYYIGDTDFFGLYSQILNEIPVNNPPEICVRVCWECRALLRRLQRFRRQVQRSYQLLTQVHANSSLSIARPPHLNVQCITSISLPFDDIIIKPEPDAEADKPEVLEVKIEPEDYTEHCKETFVEFEVEQPEHLQAKSKITKKSVSLIDRQAIGSMTESCDGTLPTRVEIKTEPKSVDAVDTAMDKEVPGGVPAADVDETRDSDEDAGARGGGHYADDGAADGQQPLAESSRNSYNGEPQDDPRAQIADTRHQCHVCLRGFQWKSYLQRHIRTHTGEKPYNCNSCGKQFSRNSDLNSHLRIHTGDKPFECKVCRRRFAYNSALKKHLRTHTGEKPHKCNDCGKQFNEKGTLNIHLRTHTGEKPFECNICEKQLSYKGHLKAHLRTHTGEKPYKCNDCGKQFSEKGHLKIHLRIHTGEKPFECKVCCRRFGERRYLRRHLKTHTGEKQ